MKRILKRAIDTEPIKIIIDHTPIDFPYQYITGFEILALANLFNNPRDRRPKYACWIHRDGPMEEEFINSSEEADLKDPKWLSGDGVIQIYTAFVRGNIT